ncbi:MAG: DUF2194 domain-containing protein, partial [Lachnospiraceae bacterium]|nr:DUF2194 domain-containing protein [Lachnospiraceae bacterium]
MNRRSEEKKKRIKAGIGGFNMGGMYILCGAFCVLAVVLTFVQASVQYQLREESLELKPKEELIKLKSMASAHTQDEIYDVKVISGARKENNCLLVLEEDEPTSYKAKQLYIPVLDQMKESYDICEVMEFDSAELEHYDRVVLAISHYPKLKESIADIKNWVKAGGNLMIAYPPMFSGSFETLYEILGIKNSGDATVVEGLHFNSDFMIGGRSHDYPIIDAFDSSLGLSLTEDCDVYIESTDEYPVPLVWRRNVEEGTIVVDNFGILEKAYRGIHSAAYSLMGDYCVYPVINGAAFYIDDFPSPVPEGDATYISRDYNMSVSDYYSQIWWNNIYEFAREHGIHLTGLVIENYSNQVEGKFERNTDTDRFRYFGNMLLRSGGEIGIHGYNHMPLVLENFDYRDQYDSYIPWPTEKDIKHSL